jgi:hypothetical protein
LLIALDVIICTVSFSDGKRGINNAIAPRSPKVCWFFSMECHVFCCAFIRTTFRS